MIDKDEGSIEEEEEDEDIYSSTSPNKQGGKRKLAKAKSQQLPAKTKPKARKPEKTGEMSYDYNEAGEKNKFQLYNMVICHSIAVGEELQFVKFLRKV